MRKWSVFPASCRAVAAFTMVEIALCLGVIAFALVAIIGVLPTGLRVQKDNRQDTILNQEGMILLEAIRSGARGMDYLTNYFDSITVSNVSPNFVQITIFTNKPGLSISLGGSTLLDGSLTNGEKIVAKLTLPKYIVIGTNQNQFQIATNYVSARVRAITGSTLEKSPSAKDMAFAYRVTSEMVPMNVYPPVYTNYLASGLSTDEIQSRSNLCLVARNEARNFFELKLTLQGPVIQKGAKVDVLGTPRTFRTLIGGMLDRTPGFNVLVQPSNFVQAK